MRICPDCQSRELEKGYRYCSECGEVRKYISRVISNSEWEKKQDPDKKNEYSKLWMREYRKKKKKKPRLCPDCGEVELEYKQKYCSECSKDRRYFSKLLANEKWKKNNPEKYKESYNKWNKKKRCVKISIMLYWRWERKKGT